MAVSEATKARYAAMKKKAAQRNTKRRQRGQARGDVRYAGATRSAQKANQARYKKENPNRANYFRTDADNSNISTQRLQAKLQSKLGLNDFYKKNGVSTDQSARGLKGERISKAGNRVVGKEHNKRYREVRAALGLTTG